MANNFTAEETHNYDQNIAWAAEQVDHLVTTWTEVSSVFCCSEHAALSFSAALLAEVTRLGPEDTVTMLLICAQRLAQNGKDQ